MRCESAKLVSGGVEDLRRTSSDDEDVEIHFAGPRRHEVCLAISISLIFGGKRAYEHERRQYSSFLLGACRFIRPLPSPCQYHFRTAGRKPGLDGSRISLMHELAEWRSSAPIKKVYPQ